VCGTAHANSTKPWHRMFQISAFYVFVHIKLPYNMASCFILSVIPGVCGYFILGFCNVKVDGSDF